ncbi:MAG: chemical-damaging agent resistance protein C [Epulopiscium sp. Nuni2H_MBin003]|nr:MAG: chemical-damaging agent resistance protein C [Epulopiscium sp. Nuni2H_MBin003]
MAINLSKGQKVSLSKEKPGLSKVLVGLGWDTKQFDGGSDFDLDGSIFLITSTGKVRDQDDFVFYGNLKHKSGSVIHAGDNRTGVGDGDDEQITIDLALVPAHVEKIVIATTIYEAEQRNQNFGQISNAYIRVYDAVGNDIIVEYDLDEDFSIETSLVFGEVYRHNGEWKFNAIGSGFFGGLGALCATYGIDAE